MFWGLEGGFGKAQTMVEWGMEPNKQEVIRKKTGQPRRAHLHLTPTAVLKENPQRVCEGDVDVDE